MNIDELFEMWKRIIMLAKKPTREEYLLITKMVFLGLTLVGGIAFIIKVAFTLFLFPSYQGG